jgi:hypothetical protein
LVAELFAAPPQAAPKTPSATTAVSAIFFIILLISCLLQRIVIYLTATAPRGCSPQKHN